MCGAGIKEEMTTLSSTLSVPLELSSPHGHLQKGKGEKKCLMFSVCVWGGLIHLSQILSLGTAATELPPRARNTFSQSVSLFSGSKMENTSPDHGCSSGPCVLPFTTITIINNKTWIPAGDGRLISPHLAFSAGRCQ